MCHASGGTKHRFYVYEAIVILVAPMRDVVHWEREVAEREAEAAEKLRALNELRAALEQRLVPRWHPVPV